MTSCMICGLKLYQFAPNQADQREWRHRLSSMTAWWGDVRLLCDPDDEVGSLAPALSYQKLLERCTITLREARTHGFRPQSEASDIEVHRAEFVETGLFHRDGADDNARDVVLHPKPPRRTFDQRHYIPVHACCLDMAQRVWKTAPEHAFIKDIRGLCIALTWRYALALKCYGPRKEYPPNYATGRFDYHLKWEEWRRKWLEDDEWVPAHALPGDHTHPLDNIPDLWGQNPLRIPHLTEGVLVNLTETPRHTRNSFEKRFFRLPNELQDMILDALPFRDLPRDTTGFLPQSIWLERLKSNCLPWLWDLDHALIDAKVQEPCPSGEGYEWNWELFVRQLSRGVDFGVRDNVADGTHPLRPIKEGKTVIRSDDTFWETTGYYNDMNYVPPGLFNRRRIWQLLEEAFVGDFVPQTGDTKVGPTWVIEDYIQLPWSKSGELLKSPKWIPAFDLEPYVRRVGGGVYIARGMVRPMQFWQDPGGFWKLHLSTLLMDWDGSSNNRMRPPKGAPPEDVDKVLRQLGYPT